MIFENCKFNWAEKLQTHLVTAVEFSANTSIFYCGAHFKGSFFIVAHTYVSMSRK